MKLVSKVLLGLALVALTAVEVSAVDVFTKMSTEVDGWLTGNLGYIIALFAFVGSVIIYAFTHKHSILFVGFLIAFFAGAAGGIAKLSHGMGITAFS